MNLWVAKHNVESHKLALFLSNLDIFSTQVLILTYPKMALLKMYKHTNFSRYRDSNFI